jgi:sugar/nucleoside kinase (ribokinase family)
VNANVRPRVLSAGILVADLVIPPLPELPEPGELTASEDFLLAPGGCAANVAISLAKLGVTSAVAGCVGEDFFGEFLQRELRAFGVDLRGLRQSTDRGTSKTVILAVAGEDRRFVHAFGANAEFSPGDIDRSLLAGCDIFYLGGFLVLPAMSSPALAQLCAEAQEGGARTVLDVVIPRGADVSIESVREILPHVDFFVPNEDEARALTGEVDPHRQAARLVEAGSGTAVVTRGTAGAVLRSHDELLEVPAPKVDSVDQSGAGDAFSAGLIAGLLAGWDLARIVRLASVVGASATTALGCSAGVFSRSEAEAFLEEHMPEAQCLELTPGAGLPQPSPE